MNILAFDLTTKKNEVIFTFNYKKEKREIYFKSTKLNNKNIGEVATCVFLPLAMKLNKNLTIKLPISKNLISSTNKIQDILNSWNTDMSIIDFSAKYTRETKRGTKTASFFSCGVDSFDTLLRNINTIDVLVYVEGYDIWPDEIEYLKIMKTKILEVAQKYKKEVIFIKSNLHIATDDIIEWGKYYHGAALAAISHLLPKEIGRVMIPSTFSYDALLAWGSHPLIDELWSSSSLKIIHEGAHLTRTQKVINIYDRPDNTPNNMVRVCLGDRSDGSYNCSRCEKCLRTMVILKIYNKKIKTNTFDSSISLQEILKNYSSINSGFVIYRMAETISFFRNNIKLANKKNLVVLEQEFKNLTRLGLGNTFIKEAVPYVPIDLLESPSIKYIFKKRLSDYIANANNGLNKIKVHKNNIVNRTIGYYGSQNIIRLKHIKKLFK